MVTLTEKEFSALTQAQRKAHLKAEERLVYGDQVKHDKDGEPIQDGIGSPGHETRNHFDAILAREQQHLEPAGAYERAVADLKRRDPKRAEALGL